MAYIIKRKSNYISMAYSLIKLKSSDDDVKASEDLCILDAILDGEHTCVNLYALDERLRNEYKIIEMVEKSANKFAFDDGRYEVRDNSNKIVNRLEVDRVGSVL